MERTGSKPKSAGFTPNRLCYRLERLGGHSPINVGQ